MTDHHNKNSIERANDIYAKTDQVGFVWQSSAGVLDKLLEELTELREADCSGDLDHVEDELGDVFITLVSYARFKKLDAEKALHRACDKFARRFQAVEAILAQDSVTLEHATCAQMEAAWQRVKANEKAL